MPCALAAVVFGIPKVQSCHQSSKRTRPEKVGIEPYLENGKNHFCDQQQDASRYDGFFLLPSSGRWYLYLVAD
jgi:hypothetical protein